ncbi:DUF3179 domain-containing (seleno)protein [Aureliella helgolandensis]|uniref:DUF3179 domain-containing protein n=1 Tax=Aureliella helgolandensis TaxID=2527968 RepID=A0A518GAG6_9BACT|nr:DUF3179 domain-containing (seleno)protein [Aureliella helgolandensis]QDV25581.1 hypothetical protein Q31a_39070 [Aureliella helgolandensis]
MVHSVANIDFHPPLPHPLAFRGMLCCTLSVFLIAMGCSNPQDASNPTKPEPGEIATPAKRTQRQSPNSDERVFSNSESSRYSASRFMRQPGLVPPLTDPEIFSPETVSLEEDSEVLGILIEKVARAYSIPTLYYHHVINDRIAGHSVVVTYCGFCSSGTAFMATINAKRALFSLHGAWQATATINDAQTQSVWLHLTGECIDGRLKGNQLSPINVRHVTWKSWRDAHPETTVVMLNTPATRFTTSSKFQKGQDDLPPALAQTIEVTSSRYPANAMVYGVALWDGKPASLGAVKAYPFEELQNSTAVINDYVGESPVVIGFDRANRSAFGYLRILEDRVLAFSATASGKLVDHHTSSIFSQDGICIEGVYVGKQLPAIFGLQAEWYGWYATYPQTDVYQVAATTPVVHQQTLDQVPHD